MAEALEEKLGVKERWTPDRVEWIEADKSLSEKAYRKAVDHLESLVISRLFELSKMNRAGTCEFVSYKLEVRKSDSVVITYFEAIDSARRLRKP